MTTNDKAVSKNAHATTTVTVIDYVKNSQAGFLTATDAQTPVGLIAPLEIKREVLSIKTRDTCSWGWGVEQNRRRPGGCLCRDDQHSWGYATARVSPPEPPHREAGSRVTPVVSERSKETTTGLFHSLVVAAACRR
jgi:hypothetical protein